MFALNLSEPVPPIVMSIISAVAIAGFFLTTILLDYRQNIASILCNEESLKSYFIRARKTTAQFIFT